MRPDSQLRLRLVHSRCRVRQFAGQGRAVVEDDVFIGRTSDGCAIMRGHWYGDLHCLEATGATIPPVPDNGIAQVHEETGAGILGSRGVVGHRGVVQSARSHLPTIVEVNEQPMIPSTYID